MALLKVSKADLMKAQVIEPKWYPAVILKVADPKPPKGGGDSLNIKYTILIEDGRGKEIDDTVNTQMMSKLAVIDAAVKGTKVTTEEIDVNTDDHVGKKVDVKVVTDTYEGRLINKIETYAPYGVSKQEVPWG